MADGGCEMITSGRWVSIYLVTQRCPRAEFCGYLIFKKIINGSDSFFKNQ